MKKRIELWEILVPTHSNDGTEISVEYHQKWDEYVKNLAGGLTILKKSRGIWVSESGTEFRENMIPVRVACTRSQIKEIIVFTAIHYAQKAVMYHLVSQEVHIYKP